MTRERQAITLTLPIELTNGNEGRKKHWAPAAERRREYERIISLKYPRPTPAPTPCRITITRVLGPKQSKFDADSLGRGNAKELIDAIVATGFLPDDGPRHVHEVTYRQDATRRSSGPSTEITIQAVT